MNLRATSFFSALPALAASASPAAEDIRGIRPPLVLPPWWRVPLMVLLAVLGLCIVALAARWLWRRAHRPETPLQRAMHALRAAEEHARAGRSHAWAEIVAETVRAALAVRLGVVVLPQTTSELARTSGVTALGVIPLLETCDLARFARAALTTEDLLARTERARAVVTALHAPIPEPSAAAPPRTSAA